MSDELRRNDPKYKDQPRLLDAMTKRQFVRRNKNDITLTAEGEKFVARKLQIDVADMVRQTNSAHHTPVGVSDRRNVDSPASGVLPRPIVDRALPVLKHPLELWPGSLAELLGVRSGHRHNFCPIVERDHRGARQLAHHDRQHRVD